MARGTLCNNNLHKDYNKNSLTLQNSHPARHISFPVACFALPLLFLAGFILQGIPKRQRIAPLLPRHQHHPFFLYRYWTLAVHHKEPTTSGWSYMRKQWRNESGMGKEYEHCLYTPPVTRSNEPQRISWKGKIGEVKDGELWNMLVGREINFRSLRQNLPPNWD